MGETEERDAQDSAEQQQGEQTGGPENYGPDGEDDGQDYVDRSKIDFDPADGLYSGTAVDGTSEIPGAAEENADSSEENADSSDADSSDDD